MGESCVSNTDDDTVGVIDLATNTQVAVIEVGDDPRGLDISTDDAGICNGEGLSFRVFIGRGVG